MMKVVKILLAIMPLILVGIVWFVSPENLTTYIMTVPFVYTWFLFMFVIIRFILAFSGMKRKYYDCPTTFVTISGLQEFAERKMDTYYADKFKQTKSWIAVAVCAFVCTFAVEIIGTDFLLN